ncbi:MAG: hypothetical protein V4631_15425 [Pseudomonadota bacterium]
MSCLLLDHAGKRADGDKRLPNRRAIVRAVDVNAVDTRSADIRKRRRRKANHGWLLHIVFPMD